MESTPIRPNSCFTVGFGYKCYESSLSYLTLDVMGGLDSGISSCTVPAFCCGPGISSVGRYGMFLEVVESWGTTEIVPGYGWSWKAEVQGLRIVSGKGYWKCRRWELKSNTSREQGSWYMNWENIHDIWGLYLWVGKSRVKQMGTR